MMNRAYMMLVALLTSLSLQALVIDEHTAYRIVCAQSPDGTLCVGREHDSWYGIMTKVKEPDLDDADYQGPLSFSSVMRDWENMLSRLVAGEDVSPFVDAASVASYIAANEMIFNCELKHAKSTFAYSANVTDGFSIEAGGDATPWIFGPLWDCDWAFGYQQSYSYFDVNTASSYFDELYGGDSGGAARRMWMAFMQQPAVSQAYYYAWHNFVANRLPELLDFCDEYYSFASRSLAHNRQNETSSTDAYCDYAAQASRAKRWLEQRAQYVLAHATAWPLPDSPVEPAPVYPDPDGPVHSTLTGIAVITNDDAAVSPRGGSPVGTGPSTGRYDFHGRPTTQGTGITIGRRVRLEMLK